MRPTAWIGKHFATVRSYGRCRRLLSLANAAASRLSGVEPSEECCAIPSCYWNPTRKPCVQLGNFLDNSLFTPAQAQACPGRPATSAGLVLRGLPAGSFRREHREAREHPVVAAAA